MIPAEPSGPWDAICVIGDDLAAGRIDETEALARLEEAGCTPAGAEEHIRRWRP